MRAAASWKSCFQPQWWPLLPLPQPFPSLHLHSVFLSFLSHFIPPPPLLFCFARFLCFQVQAAICPLLSPSPFHTAHKNLSEPAPMLTFPRPYLAATERRLFFRVRSVGHFHLHCQSPGCPCDPGSMIPLAKFTSRRSSDVLHA